MGFWIFYFFAKFFLYLKQYIAFHFFSNLALAIYAFVVPLVLRRYAQSRVAVRLYEALGAGFAFWVLWNDAYFPDLKTAATFVISTETRPTLTYALTFLTGYWNPTVFGILTLLLIVGIAIARLRPAIWPVILVAIIGIGAKDYATRPKSIDDEVTHFYEAQLRPSHTTRFVASSNDARPFDIVLLHVCSMSWDDLNRVEMQNDPFLSRFDFLLTRFNTVTSYSNPAAIRLLRSTCGQTPHVDLYKPVSDECYLLESLRRAGYETHTVFNHDGELTKTMESDIQRWAKANAPEDRSKLKLEATSFDNSPLYSNFEALDSWLKNRESSSAKRSALYYNTVTLHGGAHLAEDKQWWKRKRADIYRELSIRLFADFSKFFDRLERSKRDTLVILVAEHGAALAATRIQASDLRDIPLPSITQVPVGVRFIRAGEKPTPKSRRFDTPTSYQTIASVIQLALMKPASNEVIENPPIVETPFLAENEHARIFVHQGQPFFQNKDSAWNPLTDELLSVTNPSELGVITKKTR